MGASICAIHSNSADLSPIMRDSGKQTGQRNSFILKALTPLCPLSLLKVYILVVGE